MTQSRTLRSFLGIFAALFLAAGMLFTFALPASAQATLAPADDDDDDAELITTDELLPGQFGDATGLGQQDLDQTIGLIIRAALGFLGIIAVGIILYGGFKWMTASGNEDKVAEAKRLIIAGIIGLAIILAAYAIADFVIRSLVGATTGAPQDAI